MPCRPVPGAASGGRHRAPPRGARRSARRCSWYKMPGMPPSPVSATARRPVWRTVSTGQGQLRKVISQLLPVGQVMAPPRSPGREMPPRRSGHGTAIAWKPGWTGSPAGLEARLDWKPGWTGSPAGLEARLDWKPGAGQEHRLWAERRPRIDPGSFSWTPLERPARLPLGSARRAAGADPPFVTALNTSLPGTAGFSAGRRRSGFPATRQRSPRARATRSAVAECPPAGRGPPSPGSGGARPGYGSR